MALTTAQLTALKTAALADQTAAAFLAAGNDTDLRSWFNSLPSPEFVVWRSSVTTDEVGRTVNYIAVEALTDINRAKITTFYAMNPVSFRPTSDVVSYWNSTFGGALGGQGQATRDALDALWRRSATRAEKVLATGTGTTASPGTLTYEGELSLTDVAQVRNA